MSSDGSRIEGHMHLLRSLMSRDHLGPEEALSQLAAFIPAEDHEAVLGMYNSQTSTTIEVVGPEVLAEGGPRAWFSEHDPSRGYYWTRQRNYLAHTAGRADYELDSLDQSSDRVLAHLENPAHPEPYNIRGLVVGHVQSGKTANFSALIAKAADAGYKIVIVMSGLHNSLRQQTQRRLERDLGREHVPGVGAPEPGRRWIWMTSADLYGDFKTTASAAVLQGNDHVIFVVKKNKSRLEQLEGWMRGQVPDHVPVLVIDDEADQASVNTGGNRPDIEEVDLVAGADFDGDTPPADELDPSAINSNIRKILRGLSRCSFVAYTATPFANVLIDPAAFDREVGNDLFPRHFIISLPHPPGGQYVGATQLFGRDRLPGDPETLQEEGLDVVEIVREHEVGQLIPAPGHSANFALSVPDSLKQAIEDYVLAAGAWLTRSGKDEPCTMLIHTAMRRSLQTPLAPLVSEEVAHIRQSWLYDSDEYRPKLRERWDTKFRETSASVDLAREMSFEEIEVGIDQFLRGGVEVRVLNSDTAHNLDFDAEPNLKAILIGGNKLSRGVTIEGLLVSYFVRESLYYDTLMQMARWFGYRGRYVDLTRIYSTEILMRCFHDLATAEEDLRRQIARYSDRLTPEAFVPKVRTNPLMAVTQRNKMAAASRVSVNYAGQRMQTVRFLLEPSPELRENLELTRRFFGELGEPSTLQPQPIWENVEPDRIVDYILAFKAFPQSGFDPQALTDYINAQVSNGELLRWRVLLACARTAREGDEWNENLGVTGRSTLPLIARSRLRADPTSLGVVTEPDDELTGLSEEALRAAREEIAADPSRPKTDAYRAARSPQEGLLMIYPISAASEPGAGAKNRIRLFSEPVAAETLIAYALVFPASDSDATVEYVAAPQPGGQL